MYIEIQSCVNETDFLATHCENTLHIRNSAENSFSGRDAIM